MANCNTCKANKVCDHNRYGFENCGNYISADVVEVKHGEWIDKPTGRYMHMGSWCSVCGEKSGIGGIESNRHKPYCPNCGAKMDKRSD